MLASRSPVQVPLLPVGETPQQPVPGVTVLGTAAPPLQAQRSFPVGRLKRTLLGSHARLRTEPPK